MRHLVVTDSNTIESVGFDATDESAGQMQGTLEVVFKSSPSEVYRYESVRFETFIKLVSADSIGKAFHELFRKTKYPFAKSAKPTLAKSER